MKRRFAIKPLIQTMCISGLLACTSNVFAAGFQLWEQDAASLGNYHAGRAATASDASTAFYNPAGITRIRNQQIVLGDDLILSDIKFRGTVETNLLHQLGPQTTTGQAGAFSKVPFFHYVAPINEMFGVGLSLGAPFGLKTDYGRTSPARYVATSSELKVVDLSPSFGLNLSKQFSVGAGIDIQRASAQFNQDAQIMPLLRTGVDSTNATQGSSRGYGYHVGALFQFMPTSRVGLTYSSSVRHHLRGSSKFVGPITNIFNRGAPIVSTNTRVNLTLPAYTTLSAFHQIDSRWAVMGTAIYTQWSVIKDLVISNAAAVNAQQRASNTLTVTIPQYYRNTWNFSVGGEYYASEKITLRSGVGFDQSPTNNKYRNLQVPDTNRYAIAFGGHYQATKNVGIDLGWTHLFAVGDNNITPPPQANGAQTTITKGKVTAGADVLGAQLVWDIV